MRSNTVPSYIVVADANTYKSIPMHPQHEFMAKPFFLLSENLDLNHLRRWLETTDPYCKIIKPTIYFMMNPALDTNMLRANITIRDTPVAFSKNTAAVMAFIFKHNLAKWLTCIQQFTIPADKKGDEDTLIYILPHWTGAFPPLIIHQDHMSYLFDPTQLTLMAAGFLPFFKTTDLLTSALKEPYAEGYKYYLENRMSHVFQGDNVGPCNQIMDPWLKTDGEFKKYQDSMRQHGMSARVELLTKYEVHLDTAPHIVWDPGRGMHEVFSGEADLRYMRNIQ